jgi:polyisoprenoid-binding protein YceI
MLIKNSSKVFYSLISTLLISFISFGAFANSWDIKSEQSYIKFSGTHAGDSFEGVFEDWEGNIFFDPLNLTESQAKIKVDLSSATTGNTTYDKTLPNKDWFNIDKNLFAEYHTTKIEMLDGSENKYNVEGVLNIRGFETQVSLDANILIEDNTAIMTASTTLDRMDYKIGAKSDGEGEWVSLNIPLEIKVVAEKEVTVAEKSW